MTIKMAVRNSFSQPQETPNDHTTRQTLWGRECGDTLTNSLPCVRMSHTAWSVKLSSTLVYGATSRWNSDDRTTREKAGRTERDILIADHRALEVDMMSS